jgi:glycosyltransferase involved in cell wall biosynthesis
MRTTNVLMTADTVGGVWTYALDLVHALGEHGCEVTLAAMGGYLRPAEARAAARIRGLHLHESSYKLEWMDDPWDDVSAAGEWLLALAHKTQPDVVHLNNFAHGALAWRRPVLLVAHSCVLSWWQAVKGEPAPPAYDRYAAAVRRGIAGANLLVAPTHAMLQALRTHYGVLPPAEVIYNGRDARAFLGAAPGGLAMSPPAGKPREQRAARSGQRPDTEAGHAGLDAGAGKEPLILAVGRLWDEAKNVAALDRAAAHVAWPVYVAGEELHPGGGRQTFAYVRPLGKLPAPELAQWLRRASIYALPARYEPFGLSVLEAALAGCALVLGDIGSLREVWGSAALFIPPDDPEQLAEALNRLSRDRQLRTRLASAAYLRAQQYSQSAMGAGYWHAYQTLLVEAALPARAAVHTRTPEATPAGLRLPGAALQPSTQLGR